MKVTREGCLKLSEGGNDKGKPQDCYSASQQQALLHGKHTVLHCLFWAASFAAAHDMYALSDL